MMDPTIGSTTLSMYRINKVREQMEILRRFVICCILMFIPGVAAAKIVFASQRGTDSHIYVMNDDGSNVRELTSSLHPFHYDSIPAWSPDGQQIVFMRRIHLEQNKQQMFSLFIMNRDGSNQRLLTDPDMFASNFSWSPDGLSIAFTSNISGGWEIHVLNLITRETKQLTRNLNVRTWAAGPSWSPDGKYIAYRFAPPGRDLTTIYVMNADGRRQSPLVHSDQWYQTGPRWSPDSKYVMCTESNRSGGKWVKSRVAIYTFGKTTKQILDTPNDWFIHSTDWANNGKHVLISAEISPSTNPQIEIYQYILANGKITNLTNHPSDDYSPDWISDDVLFVNPVDKRNIQWGKLKR